MDKWKPDFSRLRAAITRESLPDRIPTAEVGIDIEMMAEFLGDPIADIKTYASFWEKAGYDYTLLQVRGQPLYDASQVKIVEGVLGTYLAEPSSTMQGLVTDEKSFNVYPWIGTNDIYYKDVDSINGMAPPDQLGIPQGPIRVHWDDDFARRVGVSGAYDFGPQRIAWLAHLLTDWMGDDGFLKALSARVVRFNVWGDVQFVKGKVVDKCITDSGGIVKIEVWAVNQRDEITAQGQGEVQLPRK